MALVSLHTAFLAKEWHPCCRALMYSCDAVLIGLKWHHQADVVVTARKFDDTATVRQSLLSSCRAWCETTFVVTDQLSWKVTIA
jgi:hypothetical protein